jgi:hypothetical protein
MMIFSSKQILTAHAGRYEDLTNRTNANTDSIQ